MCRGRRQGTEGQRIRVVGWDQGWRMSGSEPSMGFWIILFLSCLFLVSRWALIRVLARGGGGDGGGGGVPSVLRFVSIFVYVCMCLNSGLDYV